MINEIVCPKQIKKSKILFSIPTNHQLGNVCVCVCHQKRAHNDVVTLTNKRISVILIEIKEFASTAVLYGFPTNQWNYDIYIWWMSAQSRSTSTQSITWASALQWQHWMSSERKNASHSGKPFVILLSSNACARVCVSFQNTECIIGSVLDCGFTLPIQIAAA